MAKRKTANDWRVVARGVGELKRRYRPQRLDEIINTFPTTKARQIISADPNTAQVFLLEGLTGCGKTSLARIISRAIACTGEGVKPCLACTPCKTLEQNPDYVEINVADFRGIDAVRDIISDMVYKPSGLPRRVYIFDEAHQLTPASQEILNKVLEDPLGNPLIFLITTDRKGLKRTLLGRVTTIPFKRVTRDQMGRLIDQVCEDAKVDPPDKDTFNDLCMRADGSVRDLLNLLEDFLDGTYETGVSPEEDAPPDVRALADALVSRKWATVQKALQSEKIKAGPEGYRFAVANVLRGKALYAPFNPGLAIALGQLCGSLADQPKAEQYNMLVLRCMRVCKAKVP